MHLARFPRLSLGHFPTPLEALPNLSRYLGALIFILNEMIVLDWRLAGTRREN